LLITHQRSATSRRQFPSAGDYGNQLRELVLDLRADTGVPVPFATATMRIYHASWSEFYQPHNVQVINQGMHELASALPALYVVDGKTRKLPRYFDTSQHCVPSRVQSCLGWLWTAFASPCKHLGSDGRLQGTCSRGKTKRHTAKHHPACMPQHDLHFTARGQIGIGQAFAETFIQNPAVGIQLGLSWRRGRALVRRRV
jgi:hypothetical protein